MKIHVVNFLKTLVGQMVGSVRIAATKSLILSTATVYDRIVMNVKNVNASSPSLKKHRFTAPNFAVEVGGGDVSDCQVQQCQILGCFGTVDRSYSTKGLENRTCYPKNDGSKAIRRRSFNRCG